MNDNKFCCVLIFVVLVLLFVVTTTTVTDCMLWEECLDICSHLSKVNTSTYNCENPDEFCHFRKVPCFIGVSLVTISWTLVVLFTLYVLCTKLIIVGEARIDSV